MCVCVCVHVLAVIFFMYKLVHVWLQCTCSSISELANTVGWILNCKSLNFCAWYAYSHSASANIVKTGPMVPGNYIHLLTQVPTERHSHPCMHIILMQSTHYHTNTHTHTVGFPLTVLGGIMGKNLAGNFDAPCRTKNIAREIPPAPWYRSLLVHMAIGGFLPFRYGH